MVGWHHRLRGHEFEQAPGDGKGRGGLACCRPRGRKELDMYWRLNSKRPVQSYPVGEGWGLSREGSAGGCSSLGAIFGDWLPPDGHCV